MDTEAIIHDWVRDFVVALNLCPFAAGPLRRGQVAILTNPTDDVELAFNWAVTQAQRLLTIPASETETILLVYPAALPEFPTFLDFVATFEDTLAATGADALLQLAHFHPDYVFADAAPDDPANRTNRSPFPVVQLLRADALEKAIAAYGNTEAIWRRNVAVMRGEGSLGGPPGGKPDARRSTGIAGDAPRSWSTRPPKGPRSIPAPSAKDLGASPRPARWTSECPPPSVP